jgi:hypothetical protein
VNTLLVTAFTAGYRDLADRLAESCEQFGRELFRVPYDSTGDWVRNGHIKPHAMLRAMDAHPKRPVCWIDADAILRKDPLMLDLLHETGDVAFHTVPKTREALSGTVWTTSRPFLVAWADVLEQAPRMWDQHALGEALVRSEATYAPLPAEYCWIDYFAGRRWGGPREPVIEHTQASRDVRAGKREM